MKSRNKIWAMILAVTLVFGVFPTAAFAGPPAFDSGNYVKFEAIASNDLEALKTLLKEKTEGETTLGEVLWPEGLYQRMMDSGILYKQKADGIPAFKFHKENPTKDDPGKLVEIDLTGVKGMGLDKLSYFKQQLEFLSVANSSRTGELDLSEFTGLHKLLAHENNLTKIKLGSSELELIVCEMNKLKELDFLSGQKILKELYCSGNELTALDLKGLTELELIECGNNQLKTLDFSGDQENLKSLYCYENELTTLDLKNLTALELINCGDNKLKTLVFNPKNSLKWLYCYGNELTALDLKNLTALEELNLSNNKLTGTLDISGLTNLTLFDAWENPLTTIKVKNGTAISTITAVGQHILAGASMYDGVYRLGADVPEADRESFDIGSFMNNGKEMELADWDTEGYENPDDENDDGWGRLKPNVAYNITVSALPKTVTKELLSKKTAEAANYLAGIVISADGKDVPADKKWATQAACREMREAIEYAQEILNKESIEENDYRNAYNNLLMNMINFEAAVKDGTAGIDKALLNKAIADAAAAKKDVAISEKAAGEVTKGTRFVKAAEMSALNAAIKAAEDAKPITTGQANAAAKKLDAATAVFKAAIKTGTYTSSGGSSSGGSNSGGGSTTPPASPDKPSDNVGSDGMVDTSEAVKEVTSAVAEAVKNTANKTASVTVKNAEAITPAAFKEMAAAASKAGGAVILQADTVVDGRVEARLYMDTKLAQSVKADIKLGVSLSEASTAATKEKFKSFDNKIAVASFAQQGSFGMKVSVAIKADLTGLNTKTLRFYSYDKATNLYSVISAPKYWIDTNGYLHFDTTVGGDIIITDKPLAVKK